MAGAGRKILGVIGKGRDTGNKAFDTKIRSLERMIESAESGKAFDAEKYMLARNAAMDMAKRNYIKDKQGNTMSAKKVERMFPSVSKLKDKAKEAKSVEDRGGMEEMIKNLDAKELGLTKREADGIRKHSRGGTNKPKGMGEQKANRFTKKDYRRGGPIR